MLNRQPSTFEMQDASATPAREEISVAEVMTFLRWYWPLIAATVLTALAIAFIYVMTARPTYTAQTQILMETSGSDNMTRAISESMISLDTPQIESQIALLRSEQIAQKVAAKVAEFRKSASAPKNEASAPKSSWLRKLIFGQNVDVKPEPSKDDKMRAARAGIAEIQGGMEVKRIGLSYALEVSFRSSDPATAAMAANAIGDTYVQDKLETRASTAREGGRWLEARIDELRHLMNEAALDVQQFKARRDYRILDRAAVDNNPEPEGQSADKPRAEQTTLEELESRAQTYRKIYESYLQAYTETLQRQSFPGTAARVITRAEVPTSRSSPRTYFTLGVAGVLGTLFGFGLALAHMSFDQTVRSARQVQRKLGVPYLGQAYVSHLHAGLPIVRRVENLLGLRRGPDPSLTFVKSKPLSRAAQDLKDTALALKEAALARNVSVIGLLGTTNDLNAVAVASNLAIIYARAGLSTLLIDTHTSEAQIVAALASRPAQSLSELSGDSADIRSALAHADAASPFVLALRKPHEGGDLDAELVARLSDLMDQYRAAFDLVLVHIPPAGTSARGPELTKVVDAIVVVSKMRQTSLADLTDVANSMQISGKSILGVINASMV